MSNIKKVLARVRWTESDRAKLCHLFSPAEVVFVDREDDAGMNAALDVCDVAIIDGVLDDRFLHAPRLKWVHCDQSGLDGYAPQKLADHSLVVTSSKGRSGPVLAEHAVFFMLSLSYDAARFMRAQRRRVWGIRGQEGLRGLYGKRLCILGLGATGTCLAEQAKAFGMEVVAYRRQAIASEIPGVRVFSQAAGDALKDAMQGADILAVCAALNDTSYHLVGAEELAVMAPGATLVNVARAQIVDEAALMAALTSGQLSGAGLDVVEPNEPLAPWHPMWRARNVILTPHVTPQMPDRVQRSLDLIAANKERFETGQSLEQVFTHQDVFTPRQRPRAFKGRHRFMQAWQAVFRRGI